MTAISPGRFNVLFERANNAGITEEMRILPPKACRFVVCDSVAMSMEFNPPALNAQYDGAGPTLSERVALENGEVKVSSGYGKPMQEVSDSFAQKVHGRLAGVLKGMLEE